LQVETELVESIAAVGWTMTAQTYVRLVIITSAGASQHHLSACVTEEIQTSNRLLRTPAIPLPTPIPQKGKTFI